MATVVDQQTDVMSPKPNSDPLKLRAEVMHQCDGWSELIAAEETVQKAVSVVESGSAVQEKLATQKFSSLAVSIVLSDDDSVRQLNKTHRNIDKPTNVLSFPSAPGPHHVEAGTERYLGDIVIAYETVCGEAQEQGRTVHDHLSHLVIHGLLHVLGYDHEMDEDAREMEQLEVSLLATLGVANPYD